MAEEAQLAGGTQAQEGGGEAQGAAAGFGLRTATALIIGSIIGVGIFNLPTSLAFYGPISLVSMGLTTIGALALAVLFASLDTPSAGGRRPLRLRAGRLRQPRRLRQRLVLLDHGLGRQRRDRRRLGALRRALHQQGPRQARLDPAGAGRPLGRGGDQSLRGQEHGLDPGRDDDPEVLRARVHGDRRPVLHQKRQLPPRSTSAAKAP